MIDADFWLDADGVPINIIELNGARCPGCPEAVTCVPVDKTWLVNDRGHDGFLRFFVCPHCKQQARDHIDVAEAVRLFTAGVPIRRGSGRRHTGDLTEDHLIDFGQTLAEEDDLARLALEA